MPGNVILFETYDTFPPATTMQPPPRRDSRSPKRRKLSPAKKANGTATPQECLSFTTIIDDGDLVLVARGGPEGSPEDVDVPLLVSSQVLSMSSPYMKALLASGVTAQAKGEYGNGPQTVLAVNDEEPSVSLLCNILHLQHQRLPARLTADALFEIAQLAMKYQCVQAVNRVCYVWFDRIFTGLESNPQPFQTIEAAYLLDDATSFARFTSNCVLNLVQNTTYRISEPIRQRVANECHKRRTQSISDLRADIDLLADGCTFGLAQSHKHHVGMPIGVEPEEGEEEDVCEVDKEGAEVFVAALRDQKVWPSTIWPETVGEVVEGVKGFQTPFYDDSDGCEYCDGVNRIFKQQLSFVQSVHKTRLWGICLDCFKSDGEAFEGQCRVEHAKAPM